MPLMYQNICIFILINTYIYVNPFSLSTTLSLSSSHHIWIDLQPSPIINDIWSVDGNHSASISACRCRCDSWNGPVTIRVTRSCRLRHHSSKDDASNYPKEDAICLGGRPIGFISIMPGSSMGKCRGTISYALGSKYWGWGITTLAVKRAVSSAFEEFPDLERIEGIVDVNNKASQRALEKAGFLKEGVLRKYLCINEETIDFAMYSLLSTDPILH